MKKKVSLLFILFIISFFKINCKCVNQDLLFYFAKVGIDDREIIEQAVSFGCSPDAQDFAGRTPLHYAAENGYINLCKILLELGARPVGLIE